MNTQHKPAAQSHSIDPALLAPLSPSLTVVRSGALIDVAEPDVSKIRISDIAYSLARQDHYQGHAAGYEIYSEAQHCLWLATYLSRATGDAETALHGLVCNASKAYIGTMSPVVEALLSEQHGFADLQLKVQQAIYKALQLPALTPHQAHWILIAKQQAQLVESQQIGPAQLTACHEFTDTIAEQLASSPLMYSKNVETRQDQWLAAFAQLKQGELIHG